MNTSDSPGRTRPHPAWIAGGAAALIVAAAGVGAFAVNADSAATRGFGDGLRIEVVAPVEPEVEPGGVMDVGEVTDGFVFVRAQMEPSTPVEEDYWAEPAYPDPDPGYRERYAAAEVAAVYPLVQAAPNDPALSAPAGRPTVEPDRSFGFDRPRPDYRAEREARRARLDALAQRSSEQSREWRSRADHAAMPPEAIRRSDSTFY